MQLHVIGADAHAISYLIDSGATRVLVDCGVPPATMRTRLLDYGLDPLSIDAVVLTHEHEGHSRGLKHHPFRDAVPIIASHHTLALMREDRTIPRVRWCPAAPEIPFSIGDFLLEGIPVAHDAVDPFAWLVGERRVRGSLGITGDLGQVSRRVTDRFLEADTVILHANHDDSLLRIDASSDRSSNARSHERANNLHGHLSNDQAAALVGQLALRGRLRGVFLSHLEPRWNSPHHALGSIGATLTAIARTDIPVRCLRNGETHRWGAATGE